MGGGEGNGNSHCVCHGDESTVNEKMLVKHFKLFVERHYINTRQYY